MEKIMKKIMKKILMLSVVVLSLSNVIANEIFIYTNDDNVKGENVIGNEIVNVK